MISKLRRLLTLLLLLIFSAVTCLSCRHASSPLQNPLSQSSPPDVASQIPLFREISGETGLHFVHFNGATGEKYFPEMVGAGIGLIDYNNDGALDVFVVQDDMLDPRKPRRDALFPPPPDWKPGCRLFRNDLHTAGKLHFTDVTEQAGMGHLNVGYGMGVAVGDYDNDGYPDLYVTGFERSVLLHNNANGTFTDVTAQTGVGNAGNWGTSAAFVDYDRDGLLDLVVVNYVDFTLATHKKCYSPAGERDYCGPRSYRGTVSRLYHNLGHSRFQDVTQQSGFGSRSGAGLGVVCVDFSGDGWPDIFVANDGESNYLWRNQHNGTFRENGLVSGVALNSVGNPQANMGIAVGDVDNSGRDDIFISHLNQEGGVLYRNDGDGLFHDATVQYNLFQPTFAFTGFGTDWLDYDNDGRLDLFVANGEVRIVEALRTEKYPFAQRNLLLRNEGVGRPFRDASSEGGPAMQLVEISRGAAMGDLDNDGGMDVVVSNNSGLLRLLHNEAVHRGHWLEARLEGVRSNRMGLGARVGILRPGKPTLWRRCHSDGSYLCAGDARVHFGLGDSADVQAIVARWPSGLQERWTVPRSDTLLTLREGSGVKEPPLQ